MYKPSRTQWRTRADFRELAADRGADFRELAADWMRTYADLPCTKNTYLRTRRELAANLCISVRELEKYFRESFKIIRGLVANYRGSVEVPHVKSPH